MDEAHRTSAANDTALLNCQASGNCDQLRAEYRRGYAAIGDLLDSGSAPEDVARFLDLETNAQTIIGRRLDQVVCHTKACEDRALLFYGVGSGLAKLTPAGAVLGAGVAGYELTTAIIEAITQVADATSLATRMVRGVGGRHGSEGVPAARGGAANITSHEAYKDELRASMDKPVVSDPALANIVDSLYRPNATVGSGSTAAAVRKELESGQPVGGAFHSQKAQDGIRTLERWLSRNPTALPSDRIAAENVIKDMNNALRGR